MRSAKKMYLSIASVFVAVGVMVTLNVTGTTTKAESRDCEADTIIQCGVLTQSELIQKYDANTTGDIQAVYSHYGISRTDLTGATSEIRTGTVYRDGRVVVDGKTVATGAYSVSRLRFSSSSRAVTIAGKTFYEGPDMSIFVRDVQAYVMFRNGQFYNAVLISCGNPLMATPVTPPKPPEQPLLSCDSLTATKIDRTNFKFTSAATAKNGAEITSYTYNFGDGSAQTVTTPTITHTYAKAGTYTATLVVNATVDGVAKTATSTACRVTVEVSSVPVTPTSVCDSLEATKISRTTYKFTADASVSGGAEITSYIYDFGDGHMQTVNSTSVTHTYAKAGTYTAKVSVHVTVNDEDKVITGEECMATVTVEEIPVTPMFTCDDLVQHAIDSRKDSYAYTLTYTAENGATLKKVVYDFGDSTSATFAAAEATHVEHTYRVAGTYTTTATLYFDLDNGTAVVQKSVTCRVTIVISPEMCTVPGKEMYPEGSSECVITEMCTIPGKEEYPTDSPECVTPPITHTTPPQTPPEVPTELPQTGVGVETFVSGGLGISTVAGAAYAWVASRRNLLGTLMNR